MGKVKKFGFRDLEDSWDREEQELDLEEEEDEKDDEEEDEKDDEEEDLLDEDLEADFGSYDEDDMRW